MGPPIAFPPRKPPWQLSDRALLAAGWRGVARRIYPAEQMAKGEKMSKVSVFLLTLALLLGSLGVARAQDDRMREILPGTYSVRGWFANADTSGPPSYRSQMNIRPTGQNAYLVEWNNLTGIGLASTDDSGSWLSVSYQYEGKPGLAVYRVTWNGDHVYLSSGRWVTMKYADMMGHEEIERPR